MILTILLVIAAVSTWLWRDRIFPWNTPAAAPVAPRKPRPVAPAVLRPVPAVPKPSPPLQDPELEMLDWDLEAPPAKQAPRGELAQPAASHPDLLLLKRRDRYLKARFPGVASSSADLDNVAAMIQAVRLYYDERKFDRADELLELAIAQTRDSRPLRLAQLELAFRRREPAHFCAFARAYRRAHPESVEWTDIARLGRAIAPMETSLFGEPQEGHAHDRYGPWPDMPNWLQASWDLTAEVLASDFHREMARAEPAATIEPHAPAA
jgi:hypothetical protein